MKRYELEGIVYDSRSEAAISALLMRYIQRWNPEEGRTLHVYDGSTSVDFMVEDTLIEWHPFSKYESKTNYELRKKALIEKSPLFFDKNLIILAKLSEFYNLIIRKFCNPIPSYEDIQKNFQFFTRKTRKI
jgi:hypothetical protein